MPKSAGQSTFAERYEFTRDRQRVLGTWAKDEVLADAIGVSAASISDYKSRELAPPADRTLAIARWCGVDPGWLAFGEDTEAPAPEGFSAWLENQRARRPQRVAEPSPRVRDIPVEAMERVTSKKPAPRKRANDR